MRSIKDIDIDLVLATFRLMDGQLYRISRNGKYWKALDIKLDKLGRGRVVINGKTVIIARLLFILNHGRDIVRGMVIDHIDRNPWNNSIENLQELTPRDNVSKERVYNSNAASDVVEFKMKDSRGKQSGFYIGTYHDADEHEAAWLAMSPLFLFRQELKGKQQARERLIELVDAGDIVAARAWVKAFALAKGIEI